MTGPIKPPSNLPGTVPTVVEPTTPRGEAVGATFREEVATLPELPTHRVAQMVLQDVRLADVVTGLREGRIAPDGVVAAVVDRALASPTASTLTPAARDHLAKLLRQQLVDDPALAALVSDLGKAR